LITHFVIQAFEPAKHLLQRVARRVMPAKQSTRHGIFIPLLNIPLLNIPLLNIPLPKMSVGFSILPSSNKRLWPPSLTAPHKTFQAGIMWMTNVPIATFAASSRPITSAATMKAAMPMSIDSQQLLRKRLLVKWGCGDVILKQLATMGINEHH
jgi:hypothetical protein